MRSPRGLFPRSTLLSVRPAALILVPCKNQHRLAHKVRRALALVRTSHLLLCGGLWWWRGECRASTTHVDARVLGSTPCGTGLEVIRRLA